MLPLYAQQSPPRPSPSQRHRYHKGQFASAQALRHKKLRLRVNTAALQGPCSEPEDHLAQHVRDNPTCPASRCVAEFRDQYPFLLLTEYRCFSLSRYPIPRFQC
ncbi:hypothetical protein D3C75_663560 [compost metagenome]